MNELVIRTVMNQLDYAIATAEGAILDATKGAPCERKPHGWFTTQKQSIVKLRMKRREAQLELDRLIQSANIERKMKAHREHQERMEQELARREAFEENSFSRQFEAVAREMLDPGLLEELCGRAHNRQKEFSAARAAGKGPV